MSETSRNRAAGRRIEIVSRMMTAICIGTFALSMACTAALARDTDVSPESWYEKGVNYAADLRYTEAVDCFDRALGLNPVYEKALVARGSALLTVGRVEEAYADLSRAIEIDPADAVAYYTRGLVYEQVNNYEGAAEDYTAALVIKPDNVDCLFRRGLAYRELGKTDEALADFRHACELGYGYACSARTGE